MGGIQLYFIRQKMGFIIELTVGSRQKKNTTAFSHLQTSLFIAFVTFGSIATICSHHSHKPTLQPSYNKPFEKVHIELLPRTIPSRLKAMSHRQHLCCHGCFYCPGNCSSPQSAGVMGSAVAWLHLQLLHTMAGDDGQRREGAGETHSQSPRPLDDSEFWGSLGCVDIKNFMVIVEDKEEGLTSNALIEFL